MTGSAVEIPPELNRDGLARIRSIRERHPVVSSRGVIERKQLAAGRRLWQRDDANRAAGRGAESERHSRLLIIPTLGVGKGAERIAIDRFHQGPTD